MQSKKRALLDFGRMAGILALAFAVNLILRRLFNTQTMTPMIFVLGVFLVAWRTQGYLWGILASLISVFAVNFAFTYPYWEFNLIRPECLSSAVVMLVVSIMTSALTTKIKRQEQMKAEAEKERMRGNLLRAVSHDLRTPLTSIYGACSAMLENFDEIPRETHMKLLSDVCSDAQWLVRMVENLLSVTRIDADGVSLAKNDTVLEELIDTVLVKFHKHYPQQAVHLGIPDDFVSIPMDAMLISQVLMNLLENAVFHAKGMKNLWLRVEVRGGWAYFSVEDDGCGIPEEKLPKLFTGMLDSEAPTDLSRSSMGIGLSVCSAIIKAHGGDIWAKRRPEGGTEVGFRLEMEDHHGEQQI
ncbi:MAG: DUF4118 domain-containing protein [Firmicutes bacterium]|nr:DUF4118 domain-containing protein [Bacillota bacterium]